jgi:hypothetical protein
MAIRHKSTSPQNKIIAARRRAVGEGLLPMLGGGPDVVADDVEQFADLDHCTGSLQGQFRLYHLFAPGTVRRPQFLNPANALQTELFSRTRARSGVTKAALPRIFGIGRDPLIIANRNPCPKLPFNPPTRRKPYVP